ncbi:biotin transporter BioY [Veillonella sp. VA137]|uniref:biotin transporter BioY n=1 Tax=Veillonella sp. VA137 TaxID=741828 RepID=UPI000F8D5709|nr:biotin transporter BioY [Veillonella sp. VA137]
MKEESNVAGTMSARQITMTALFVALVAVGAFIKIPIPYLPFTLQLLFTTLAGLILGSRLGGMSVVMYLILGLVGVPIFTEGGGLMYVVKPTFGYLLGFAIGAFVAGRMVETSVILTFKRLLAASFVNLAIVYGVGMIYLYEIKDLYLEKPIGLDVLFIYCFALPVIPDIFLCILAAVIAKRLLPILKREYTEQM